MKLNVRWKSEYVDISTLIAAAGRKCYTMELDEHYCSVIIDRWEKFTNKKAVKL